MSDYAEIIKRLERATGPDRELDAQIAQAVGAVPAGAFRPCAAVDVGTFATAAHTFWTCDPYTASIDAALTLLRPEDKGWHVAQHDDDGTLYWCASVESSQVYWAAGPAIALCLAAFMARAAIPANNENSPNES